MISPKYPLIFTLIAIASLSALAQTDLHSKHSPHSEPPSHHSQPYTELVKREIKALSAQDVQGFIEGQGMSLALAAELNGYPGPQHTLEFAQQLTLSEKQIQATQDLLLAHKAEVSMLGKQLVEQEKKLDAFFASKTMSAELIDEWTAVVAKTHAAIRASHLKTHLLQTSLLTLNQISQYQVLRGYVSKAH